MVSFFDNENNSGIATIFFIHGFFMDSRMFSSQISVLNDRFRVICLDVRCFGCNASIKEAFSLYDVVDDIISIANSLSIKRFIICGMSMGGYIALRAVIKYPERVSGLILIATQHSNDLPNVISLYTNMKRNWGNEEVRKQVIADLLPVFFLNHMEESNFWRDVWLSYSSDNIDVAMNALIQRDCIADEVRKINVPTLIIHGKDDHGIPYEQAIMLQACIKKSEIHLIPDAGHAVNVTKSDEVNNIILQWIGKYF